MFFLLFSIELCSRFMVGESLYPAQCSGDLAFQIGRGGGTQRIHTEKRLFSSSFQNIIITVKISAVSVENEADLRLLEVLNIFALSFCIYVEFEYIFVCMNV